MNDFYDIVVNNSNRINPLQLSNLGNKFNNLTIIFPNSRSSENENNSSSKYYRSIVSDDYDNLFTHRILKTSPPYEIEKFIDYHFDYFSKKFPEKSETFMKHIKYTILPKVKSNKNSEILIELINDWISKNDFKKNRSNFLLGTKNTNMNSKNQAVTKFNEGFNGDVFISYSWNSAEYINKIVDFTNHLRKNGFNANIDQVFIQESSSINFYNMMLQAFQKHNKIIIILSEEYKIKADNFGGGVGTEYELIINEIKKDDKKFILVSFTGYKEEIIPYGLNGREVIDLTLEDGFEKLYSKLTGENKFEFLEVSNIKPKVNLIPVSEFTLPKPNNQIRIEPIEINEVESVTVGGLYEYIKFSLKLGLTNTSMKVLNGFGYSISINKIMINDSSIIEKSNILKDNYLKFNDSYNQNVYPNQTIIINPISFSIDKYNIREVLNSKIIFEVYIENETKSSEIFVLDIEVIKNKNEGNRLKKSINSQLFN